MLKKAVHILACLAPLCCVAQADLSGTVTDAKTGAALSQVAVFVPELHIGVLTDSTGHFLLHVPQPGRFTVEFNDPLTVDSFYSVYDAMGQLLFQRPLAKSQASEEIDLSRYGKGMYLVRFTDRDGVCAERVVVQ